MKKVSFGTKAEILVVDDSRMILSLVRRILDKTYTVHTVASGEECLQFVQDQTPDLILLDFHMKGIDGLETLHHLKKEPRTNLIPVIFLTGDEHNETEILSLQEGAIDFISKKSSCSGRSSSKGKKHDCPHFPSTKSPGRSKPPDTPNQSPYTRDYRGTFKNS